MSLLHILATTLCFEFLILYHQLPIVYVMEEGEVTVGSRKATNLQYAVLKGSLLEDVFVVWAGPATEANKRCPQPVVGNANIVTPTCSSERNMSLPHTPLQAALPQFIWPYPHLKEKFSGLNLKRTYNKRGLKVTYARFTFIFTGQKRLIPTLQLMASFVSKALWAPTGTRPSPGPWQGGGSERSPAWAASTPGAALSCWGRDEFNVG